LEGERKNSFFGFFLRGEEEEVEFRLWISV